MDISHKTFAIINFSPPLRTYRRPVNKINYEYFRKLTFCYHSLSIFNSILATIKILKSNQ